MPSTPVEGSLSSALTSEHRRLDELWNETRRTVENDASAERITRLEAFGKELRRHILDEEEILFPRFEERTGTRAGGPTAVMRMEHRQMEALIQELITTLGKGSGPVQVAEQTKVFSSLMDGHDKKEEGMLYPMMDRAFGEVEGPALLAKTSLGRCEA